MHFKGVKMRKFFMPALTLFMLGISMNSNAKTIINYGEMKITYYCPCEICSEGYGRLTATKTYAKAGRTIAVDPDIIDLGSIVMIGDKKYKAEDVGGAEKGDHIDVFVNTHEETMKKGIKYKNVLIIKK